MTTQKIVNREFSESAPEYNQLPLVLDVDGTLLNTDLLHETAISYVKENPFRLFLIILWLLQGKAYLKRQIAMRVDIDITNLPSNEKLVGLARVSHQRGRIVGLATATDELIANKLSQRFEFVDFVIGSDGETNLKGSHKANALNIRFPNGFVYAGNDRSDIDIWKQADAIILVGASRETSKAAHALGKVIEAEISRPRLTLQGWVKALRLHQWAKNVLVFIPLVLGGLVTDITAWFNATIAFLALGILASATYLVNDLWDIEDDRRHWSKRKRPLASGYMTIKQAVIAIPVALIASMVIGSIVGPTVVAVLLIYLALTLAYSFAIKRKPVLDTFTLAALFTLRLVLGIAAVGVVASPWLLVFSMFLFTSLSFAKRLTEVLRLVEKGQDTGDKVSGRGYFVLDTPFILNMGVSCAIASILIMVLYLTQHALLVDFYANSNWLWAIPPVLFLWLSRIWLIAQRGELLDDPIIFAMRDPKSLVLCGCLGASFIMAWLGVPF